MKKWIIFCLTLVICSSIIGFSYFTVKKMDQERLKNEFSQKRDDEERQRIQDEQAIETKQLEFQNCVNQANKGYDNDLSHPDQTIPNFAAFSLKYKEDALQACYQLYK